MADAYGGAAADAGFVLSSGNNTVIGVSFTAGVTIPAGSGILVTLEYTGVGDPCLSDLILSDSGGVEMASTLEDCLTISHTAPCDDIDADDIFVSGSVADETCSDDPCGRSG